MIKLMLKSLSKNIYTKSLILCLSLMSIYWVYCGADGFCYIDLYTGLYSNFVVEFILIPLFLMSILIINKLYTEKYVFTRFSNKDAWWLSKNIVVLSYSLCISLYGTSICIILCILKNGMKSLILDIQYIVMTLVTEVILLYILWSILDFLQRFINSSTVIFLAYAIHIFTYSIFPSEYLFRNQMTYIYVYTDSFAMHFSFFTLLFVCIIFGEINVHGWRKKSFVHRR